MGIIIRQSFKYTLVAYFGVVLGAFNVLWLFPKFLTETEIGIIKILDDLAIMLAGLGGLGVTYIADKFFPVFKNPDKKHQGFLVFLLLYTLLGFIIISVVALIFSDLWIRFYQAKSPEILVYFYLIIPLAFFWAFLSVLESYARVHLRIAIPNMLREVVLKILIISSLFFYIFHWIDFKQLLIWRVVFYAILVIGMFLYLKRLQILFLKPDFQLLNTKKLKEITSYGLWITLGGLGTLLVAKIDSLLIPAMLGTKDLGIYAIAFFLGTVLEIPRRAISQISMPILAQVWADNRVDKIQEIYQKSSLNQLIIGTLLFLGIWLNVDNLFQIIPNGNIYQAGKYVVFWVGLTRWLDMLTGVSSEILYQSEYYRFNLFLILFLGFWIALTSWLLIPLYGISGAAAAIFVSYFLFNLIKFFFIWFKIGLQPFNLKTLIIIILGIITYGFTQLLPNFNSIWLNIFVKSAFISLFFGGMVLILKVSEEVNQIVQYIFKSLRFK